MTPQDTDREYAISTALDDANSTGVRTSARLNKVARSTLRGRSNGAVNIHEAKEKTQRLTVVQEEDLVNWVMSREEGHQPVTKVEVHAFAATVACLNGQKAKLGKNWVDRFISRHSRLKMKPSRLIEAARKAAVTEDTLNDYYSGLEKVIRDKCIGSDRMFNVDETGVQEGETRAHKVLGTALTTHSETIKSNATAWISILEAISACGRRLTPCVIFTGAQLQGQWFEKVVPGWKFDSTPSGWSDAVIFLKWFLEVFLPETKPADESLWRLLVLDGHKTHVTPELMKKAWLHKVWLSWLPSHSSHITQPLDVGVFSPLKTYYHQETRAWASYDTSSPRQKQRFMKAYKIASEKAFSQENIRSSFRAAGIYPTDVSKALSALPPPKRFRQPDSTPTTPKKKKKSKEIQWDTPHSSRDVQSQLQRIDMQLNTVSQDVQDLLKKVGTTLDANNSEITHLRQEVAILKAQLAAKQPSGKSTVEFDPNKAFPRIEDIITSRDIAEKHVIARTQRPARKSKGKKKEKSPEK